MEKAIWIAVIGCLLLFIGISMPAQQTQSTTTCVDSTYGFADGCIESTYTVPNLDKPFLMIVGFVMTTVGVGAYYNERTSNSSTVTSSITERNRSDEQLSSDVSSDESNNTMLHEQIDSNKNKNDK
jgi:uncharacterized membrane protein